MLHVFFMHKGSLGRLEIALNFQNVKTLNAAINKKFKIPENKQILLVSGGHLMESNFNVCDYGAGEDESNPIFVFHKDCIDESFIPNPDILTVDVGDLPKKIKSSISMIANRQTLSFRVKLLAEVYDLALKCKKAVDTMVLEQHTLVQGWSVALANLAETSLAFQNKVENARHRLKNFQTNANDYRETLAQFESIRDLLVRIPFIVSLNCSSTHAVMKQSDANNSCLNEDDDELQKSLYDWIIAHDSRESLAGLVNEARRSLELLTSEYEPSKDLDTCDSLVTLGHQGPGNAHTDPRLFSERLDQLGPLSEACTEAESKIRTTYDCFVKDEQRLFNNSGKDLANLLPELCHSHGKQLEHVNDWLQQLTSIVQRCARSKIELANNLTDRQRWLMKYQNEVMRRYQGLLNTDSCMSVTHTAYQIVTQLLSAPRIYGQSLSEVVRRRDLAKKYDDWTLCICCASKAIHQEEDKRRVDLNKDLKGHFLQSLFRSIIISEAPSYGMERVCLTEEQLPFVSRDDLARLVEQVPELETHLKININTAAEEVFQKFQLCMPSGSDDSPKSTHCPSCGLVSSPDSISPANPRDPPPLPATSPLSTVSVAVNTSFEVAPFTTAPPPPLDEELDDDDVEILGASNDALTDFQNSRSSQRPRSLVTLQDSGVQTEYFVHYSPARSAAVDIPQEEATLRVTSALASTPSSLQLDSPVMELNQEERSPWDITSSFCLYEKQHVIADDDQAFVSTIDLVENATGDVRYTAVADSFHTTHTNPSPATSSGSFAQVSQCSTTDGNTVTLQADLNTSKRRICELESLLKQMSELCCSGSLPGLRSGLASTKQELQKLSEQQTRFFEEVTSTVSRVSSKAATELRSVKEELDAERMRLAALHNEYEEAKRLVESLRSQQCELEKKHREEQHQLAEKYRMAIEEKDLLMQEQRAQHSSIIEQLKTGMNQSSQSALTELKQQLEEEFQLEKKTVVQQMKQEFETERQHWQEKLETSVKRCEENLTTHYETELTNLRQDLSTKNRLSEVSLNEENSTLKQQLLDQEHIINDLNCKLCDSKSQQLKDRELIRRLMAGGNSAALSTSPNTASTYFDNTSHLRGAYPGSSVAASQIQVMESSVVNPSSLNNTLPIRSVKFVHYGFRAEDIVLFVPYHSAEQWIMLSSDGNLYFLHDESYPNLGLTVPRKRTVSNSEDSSAVGTSASWRSTLLNNCKDKFILGLFKTREKCQAKKVDNRFNLPLNFVFYRVKAKCLPGYQSLTASTI